MQAFAGVADQRRQPLLDIEMHILVVDRPREVAAIDFATDGGHAAFDGGEIGRRNDALAGQHARVGQRPADVLQRHALIEADRCRIALDQIRYGLGESARPSIV